MIDLMAIVETSHGVSRFRRRPYQHSKLIEHAETACFTIMGALVDILPPDKISIIKNIGNTVLSYDKHEFNQDEITAAQSELTFRKYKFPLGHVEVTYTYEPLIADIGITPGNGQRDYFSVPTTPLIDDLKPPIA